MSERKCIHCTRPAAFLSASCEVCLTGQRKASQKLAGRRLAERLRDPAYMIRRRAKYDLKVSREGKISQPKAPR